MLHRSSFCSAEYGVLGMGRMVAKDPRRLGDPARYYHRDDVVYETLTKAYQDASGTRCKIAVVHQPPRKAQDTLYNGESSESVSLRRFVDKHQPDLLLYGHIHESRRERLIGSTQIVNVEGCEGGFVSIIEIDEDITVNWIKR
jgi:uncharacterized protein